MAAVRSRKKNPSKRSSSSLKRSPPMASVSSSPFLGTSRLALLLLLIVSAFFVPIYMFSKSEPAHAGDGSTPVYSVEVVNEFPHDPKAFTQGLLYGGDDTLFESTGLYGESSVRRVALHTGKVEVLHKMDNSYFGEGLTLLDGRLIQVTWLKKTGFIYDRNNFSKSDKFTHEMHDGWGLATDGKVLFGSDGTSTLYQIDPQTFKVRGKYTVKYKNHEVHNLNELEFVNGEVWANVYQTDCIARISYNDGVVRGWILLSNLREGLLKAGKRSIDVLNGIAWDSVGNRLFVTGKLWPKLYEIKLHRRSEPFDGAIENLCIREPFQFWG